MRWPSQSYGAYAEFVATVLVTIALLQYAGLSGPAGEFDLAFLVGTGCTLPIATYLLALAAENTRLIPQWERMVAEES